MVNKVKNNISHLVEKKNRDFLKDKISYGVLISSIILATSTYIPLETYNKNQKKKLEEKYNNTKFFTQEEINLIITDYLANSGNEISPEIKKELTNFLSNKQNQDLLFKMIQNEIKERKLEEPISTKFFIWLILYCTAYTVLINSARLKNQQNRITYGIFTTSNFGNFYTVLSDSVILGIVEKIATTPASWLYGMAGIGGGAVTLIDTINKMNANYSFEVGIDNKVTNWNQKLKKITGKNKEEINKLLEDNHELTINDILFSGNELKKANKYSNNSKNNSINDNKELIMNNIDSQNNYRVNFDIWEYKDGTKRYDGKLNAILKKEDLINEKNISKQEENALKGLIEAMSHLDNPQAIYTTIGEPLYWNKAYEEEYECSIEEGIEYYKENGEILTLFFPDKEDRDFVIDALESIKHNGKGYKDVAFTITGKKSKNKKTLLFTTNSILNKKYTARSGRKLTNQDEIQAKLNETLKLIEKDCLTGAYSKHSYENDFKKLQESKNIINKNEKILLAYIDIDYFKQINDNFGHIIGDDVLKIFVEIFTQEIYNKDKLYRLGGDEFSLIIRNINDKNILISKINRLKKSFLEEIKTKYGITNCGLSIGLKEMDISEFQNKPKKEIENEVDKYMYFGKQYKNENGLIEKNAIVTPKINQDTKEIEYIELIKENYSLKIKQ